MQANVMGRLGTWESPWLSRFFVLVLAIVIAWLIAMWPLSWAALLVFGSILLVLAAVKPRWALYTLPFAVPFGSIYEIQVGPAMVGGTEALLGGFLLGWIARGIAQRDLHLPRPPLWDVMLLWYVVMLLSVSQSSSLAASLKELVKWGEMFALYAIAVHELKRRDMVILVAMTLVAGTLEALEGIYQSWYLIGPDPFRFPIGNQIWLRAYGRFVQPNPYAGYLGLVLPLAYGLVIVMRDVARTSIPACSSCINSGFCSTCDRNPEFGAISNPNAEFGATSDANAEFGPTCDRKAGFGATFARPRESTDDIYFSHDRIFRWAKICTTIMLIALILTWSRGGWIGALLAVASVSILLGDRRAPFLLLLIGALIGMMAAMADFLPAQLANRMSDIVAYFNVINLDVSSITLTPGNFSIVERLAHWEAGLNMWADKPWLGQGIGNYAAVYPTFYTPPWLDPLGHAHNFLLNTLAETGVIGLIAYLIFWVSALRFILEAIPRSTGLWRGIAIGVFAAMVHLHVHNFFDNLYVHGMYLHVALLLAIAAKLHHSEGSEERAIKGQTVHDTKTAL